MQVRLSPDFFRKERNQAYRNWKSALWRELVQNAVDARCSQISITTLPTPGGFVLKFADNGPGMSRDVLENVYFAVGATTKTDSHSVGGMGRARMLTCFAMNAYSIRSHDYVVTGSGGEYHVADAPFSPGCVLDIDVDSYDHDLALSYLRDFLAFSNIRATVVINDVRYTDAPLQRGRHARMLVANEEIFANVFVNKSSNKQRCIVRVNGVMMFSTPISFDGQVIVELVPEVSRLVLTSNRDGLRGDYADILSNFLTELSVNTKSATRGQPRRRTMVKTNGGALTVRRTSRMEKTRQSNDDMAPVSNFVPATSHPVETEIFETQDVSHLSYSGHQTYADRLIDDAERWIRTTFGDIYLVDETANPKVRKSISQYSPDKWQIGYNRSTGGLKVKGGNIIKLLLVWKVCVSYALEILCDLTGDSDHNYSLGFLFDDENTMATHRSVEQGSLFSLLPVDANGKMAYSITGRSDLIKLMVLAQHEVTHVRHSWHNESFSSTREAIGFQFDQAECFRRIKDAIKTMPF